MAFIAPAFAKGLTYQVGKSRISSATILKNVRAVHGNRWGKLTIEQAPKHAVVSGRNPSNMWDRLQVNVTGRGKSGVGRNLMFGME